MVIVDRLRYAIMTLQIEILITLIMKTEDLQCGWMDMGYLLKDGTLFCFIEEKILKSAQAKNTSIHKRPLTFALDIDKS